MTTRQPRTMPMLRALAAAPGGLSTPELARLVATDIGSRGAALTRCGNLMRHAETAGHVQAAGTISNSGRPSVIWQITETGRHLASLAGIPGGMSGSCFLALGAIGKAATSTEIRLWLAAQDEHLTPSQVRTSMNGLTRRKPPLVELARRGRAGYGQPDLWRLTSAGQVILAEDDPDHQEDE